MWPESSACPRRAPVLRRLSVTLLALLATPVLAEPAGSPAAAADQGDAYIDQLIDPQAADSAWLADYEDGFILHGRRETRDYGEFEMLATARYEQQLAGHGAADCHH
jgi:hypothetical protein